jgi:acetyltransferase-like isoleucine patch superfamily enzyme
MTRIRFAVLELIDSALRHIGSVAGVSIRRAYYRCRLRNCGRNLRIDCGVYITNPGFISLGDDVILDKGVIIIAGSAGDHARTRHVPNPECRAKPGEVIIGSHAHLGIGTILQGHGGVEIGDDFTSSSHCMIYSLSNDPRRCQSGTVGGASHEVHYIQSPVKIGDNVWLGLHSIMIGNTLGNHVFAKPYSLILTDIADNQIIMGQPAVVTGPRFGPVHQSSSDRTSRNTEGFSP